MKRADSGPTVFDRNKERERWGGGKKRERLFLNKAGKRGKKKSNKIYLETNSNVLVAFSWFCKLKTVAGFFFFVINIFYLFFTHNNITSTQNKQNKTTDTYSMFQKSNQRGEREGGKKQQQNRSFLHTITFYGVNILTHRFAQQQNLSSSHSAIKHLEYTSNIHNLKIALNKWKEAISLPFCKWHANASVRYRHQNTWMKNPLKNKVK